MSGTLLYAIEAGGDLLWYRHEDAGGGSAVWADDHGRKVGNGWADGRVFSGGNGIVYRVAANGDLFWYRHDGYNNGGQKWAPNNGVRVGVGWNVAKVVFSGGGGVIYTIDANGDLFWYRHLGFEDGSSRWADNHGRKIGSGWQFKDVFPGGGGVIYALAENGDLFWFQHTGGGDGSATWVDGQGRRVGTGWNFTQVLCAGDGIFYAMAANGDLYWNWHLGWGDGSFKWSRDTSVVISHNWTYKRLLATSAFWSVDTPTSEEFGWGSMLQNNHPASGERAAVVVLTEYDADGAGGFPTFAEIHGGDYYQKLAFGHPAPPFTTDDPVNPASLDGYLRECSRGRFGLRSRGVVGPLRMGPYPYPDPGPEQRFKAIIERAAHDHPDAFATVDVNADHSISSDELLVLSVENFRPPIGWPANRDNIPVQIALPAPESAATVAVHVAGVAPFTPFYQIAHEFSHSLGTVDMYNNGAGNALLTLMGGYNFFSNDQGTVHLDAWHKMALGWCRPSIVELDGSGSTVVNEIVAKYEGGPVLLWSRARGTAEYFLVERRTPHSQTNVYDSAVAGDGVLIWRVVTTTWSPATHLGAPGLSPGGNAVWTAGTTTPALTWSDGSSTGVRLSIAATAAGPSRMKITQSTA